MKQPDFNTIPVYHCEVFDNDKKVFSCLMNSKAWFKTIENNVIWEYTENGRVVEHSISGFVPATEDVVIDGDKIILKLKKVADEVREDKNIPLADVLKALEATIQQRKHDMPENSYTTHLFQKGEEKILKKLGEETIEVILARNNEGETVYEVADVLYHLMVYLVSKDISFDKVLEELRSRM
jgi:phosphoribosyl-ATP pyrophosphohydrolase